MTTTPPSIEDRFDRSYLDELLAAVVAEVTATYDRRIERLQSEIDELKGDRSFRAFSDKLDATLSTCNALIDRLERREPSGTVVDLPAWPRRSGRDVN